MKNKTIGVILSLTLALTACGGGSSSSSSSSSSSRSPTEQAITWSQGVEIASGWLYSPVAAIAETGEGWIVWADNDGLKASQVAGSGTTGDVVTIFDSAPTITASWYNYWLNGESYDSLHKAEALPNGDILVAWATLEETESGEEEGIVYVSTWSQASGWSDAFVVGTAPNTVAQVQVVADEDYAVVAWQSRGDLKWASLNTSIGEWSTDNVLTEDAEVGKDFDAAMVEGRLIIANIESVNDVSLGVDEVFISEVDPTSSSAVSRNVVIGSSTDSSSKQSLSMTYFNNEVYLTWASLGGQSASYEIRLAHGEGNNFTYIDDIETPEADRNSLEIDSMVIDDELHIAWIRKTDSYSYTDWELNEVTVDTSGSVSSINAMQAGSIYPKYLTDVSGVEYLQTHSGNSTKLIAHIDGDWELTGQNFCNEGSETCNTANQQADIAFGGNNQGAAAWLTNIVEGTTIVGVTLYASVSESE
tara:strand:+ start:1325 stop:2746 length:1422 start_codon:yes stop_codon:yes gene_type:complete